MKKKMIALLLGLGCISLTFGACGSTGTTSGSAAAESTADAGFKDTAEPLSSTDEVTMDWLIRSTTPSALADRFGAFSASSTYTGTGDETLEGAVDKQVYAKNGETYEINDIVTYPDEYVTNIYFTNDSSDPTYYITSTGGTETDELEDGYADDLLNSSILGLTADDCTISEVKEENETYIASITAEDGSTMTITIDPVTGTVVKAVSQYAGETDDDMTTCTMEFDYSESVAIDYSALTDNEGNGSSGEDSSDKYSGGAVADGDSAAGADSEETSTSSNGQSVTINTTDLNGDPVTEDVIKDAKVVLLNFWEPWCSPCVGEMPDLQKLYDTYKDKGLVVLGVYSTFDQDDDAKAIVEENKITYPILRCNDELAALEQSYVPATYLLDNKGNIISSGDYAGAKSYTEWEKIIKEYLE